MALCSRVRSRAALAALLLACNPPALPAADQAAAPGLAELERESGSRWRVRFRSGESCPALLEARGARPAGSGAATAAAARAFVSRYPGLFPIADPAAELAGSDGSRDELGVTHVPLARRHRGVPVWGDGLRFHFAGGGALVRVEGRWRAFTPPDHLTPAVTATEAFERAQARFARDASASPPALGVDAPEAPPGVVPGEAGAVGPPRARLAWRVELLAEAAASEPARTAFFVDAESGEVYRREELLDTLRATGSGVFGETREFEVAQSGGHYRMEDATAGRPAQRIHTAAGGGTLPGSVVTSDQLDRWDQVASAGGAAVDAAAHLTAAHRYFLRVHGRRGADDRSRGMTATVHYGDRYAGAFWNGRQLVFGDGDGVTTAPLAGALDVVAHELAHAVIESAADLPREGEGGALNEAYADLFACLVERSVEGDAANWTVGERVLLGAGPPPRDLADPRRAGLPSHTREQRRGRAGGGASHDNATIAGHAGFLLLVGGAGSAGSPPVEAVGIPLGERVLYRALTRYLGPWSDFIDAADATRSAAQDLQGEGSGAALSAVAAWRTVGVEPTP